MITKTAINLAVIKNLIHAIREAQKNGTAFVYNRKGVVYLTVNKVTRNKRVFFQVLDLKGKNLKSTIVSGAILRVLSKSVTLKVAHVLIARLGYQSQLGLPFGKNS